MKTICYSTRQCEELGFDHFCIDTMILEKVDVQKLVTHAKKCNVPYLNELEIKLTQLENTTGTTHYYRSRPQPHCTLTFQGHSEYDWYGFRCSGADIEPEVVNLLTSMSRWIQKHIGSTYRVTPESIFEYLDTRKAVQIRYCDAIGEFIEDYQPRHIPAPFERAKPKLVA